MNFLRCPLACGILCILLPLASLTAQIVPEDIAVVDTLRLDAMPLFMALTPDADKLYIVKQSRPELDAAGGVWVVDTETATVAAEIGLDAGFPLEIALAPDGQRAYLAVSGALGETISPGSCRIDIIDTATDLPSGTIAVEGSMYGPTGTAASPAGDRVYVTHRGDGQILVLDATEAAIDTTIQLNSAAPVTMALTPDGNRLYVVHRQTSTVTLIDTQTDSLKAEIPLSLLPSQDWASIALTPDGTRAYVTSCHFGCIAVVDTDPASPTYNEEIEVVSSEIGNLAEIAVSPDGTFLCVSSHATDKMLVLDIDPLSDTYHQFLKIVPVGASPRDIVIRETVETFYAYAANQYDSTVSVVAIPKTPSSVDPVGAVPETFVLEPAFPNPFNPSTTIAFDLPRAARIDLSVCDLQGRRIRTLISSEVPPGRHTAEWHGDDDSGRPTPSGVYLILLETDHAVQTQKVILLR